MLKRATLVMETLYAIAESKTAQKTIDVFSAFAQNYGFTCFFITQLANPSSPEAGEIMLHSNFPKPLVEKRKQLDSLLRDPIIQYGLRSRYPFSWTRAMAFANRFGKKFASDATDFNLRDGYMFPMRRPGSLDGGISLGTEKLELDETAISELQIVAMDCYYHLETLNKGPYTKSAVSLSPQETEVLHFIGAGKTFEDVATILNISKAGAKAAMMRARDKLDAMNSIHAVTEAIRRDLISL